MYVSTTQPYVLLALVVCMEVSTVLYRVSTLINKHGRLEFMGQKIGGRH